MISFFVLTRKKNASYCFLSYYHRLIVAGSEKTPELRPVTVPASLKGSSPPFSFSSSSSSSESASYTLSSTSAAISARAFFRSTNLRLSSLSFASDLARVAQSSPVSSAIVESSDCDLFPRGEREP